jgi:hypothetical protein
MACRTPMFTAEYSQRADVIGALSYSFSYACFSLAMSILSI